MLIDIRPPLGTQINNFKSVDGFGNITLSWDLPILDPDYKAAEIWWNTVNDRETGMVYGTFAGNTVTINISDNDTRYFWIRTVNPYGRTDGLFTGPVSGSATVISGDDVVMDLASQNVVGNLDKGRITGLGALAALNKAGITDIEGLGALAAKDVVTADVIGAGILAAGVVYAGTVKASQIEALTLRAVSATIGRFSTSTSGARTEISDDGIKVYDSGGHLRVRIGNLNA